MSALPTLDETNAWTISGIRTADGFFREVHALLPDATHMYMEGSPEPDVVALLAAAGDSGDYGAPIGTLWSWPGRTRRISVQVSEGLLAHLAEAASRHAEPEICDHIHFYRGREPLLQWFDAFTDPLFVSKSVARERVLQFCSAVGGAVIA